MSKHYSTSQFEQAVIAAGCSLSEIQKVQNHVSKAIGHVPQGRKVYWNATGKCYTLSGIRFQECDLQFICDDN